MAASALDILRCCRPCLRRLCSQSRTFTTTPARRKHGPLPTFTPTPSPDLDALLSTFRTNVFLPSHLVTLQRSLVYRKKNHALLTSDQPATVRIGDEVHQLRPLDRQRDEPQMRPAFIKVVKLMAETGEWRNLPGFLEGLKTAGRRIKVGQMGMMVRKACEGGGASVVIDCLRRVERTGLGLWELEIARECMLGAVVRCVQSGWTAEGVERGAKFADQVWELMADPRHTERMARDTDPKRRPEILGVLLLMHSCRVLLAGEAEHERDHVKKYTELMLKQWDNKDLNFEDGDWHEANHTMQAWAPVWRGMIMAKKVLGSSAPPELEAKLSNELEPLMQRCQAILSAHSPEGGTRRGLKIYEELSQVSV